MSATLGPLEGINVLDFTMNMSGPFATMVMGDQGADVIKVEPPSGDPVRKVGSGAEGMSGYFANLNRSKRSICIDLSSSTVRPVVERLVRWADVAVMNFRNGVAGSLGLDAPTLQQINPRLVHVEITGYGRFGPYANRPAYDHVVQAMSGFADLQAQKDSGEPQLVRQGVIDKATGLTAAQAVCAALVERSRTDRGRAVEISMLQVALSFLWPDGMMNHTVLEPTVSLPPVANSFRLTKTKDGYIAFAVMTDQQWVRLLSAMGLSERWSSGSDLMRAGGAVMREVAKRLGKEPTGSAVAHLAEAEIPVAPVVTLGELHTFTQTVAGGYLNEFVHPVLGPIRQAKPLVPFSDDTSVEALLPAARLGEHTKDVLAQLGLAGDALTGMLDGGEVR